MLKKIIIIAVILAIAGVATGLYMWNKPHPKAEDAKGITIAADALSKEYNTDEKAADLKYLNKVIEVSGTVSEVDNNQDGGIMVLLQTGDPIAVVQCAMRDKGITISKGQNVTLKGFCSGNSITGVSLTGCVVK